MQELFCLLICGIASQLIEPSPFTSLWGGSVFFFLCINFCDYAAIKVNSHYVFSASKNHLILTLLATQIQTGKGCIIASKYIKESEKHIYREKLLWFVCFFILWG
jgi:hypothetical protein